MERTPNPDSPEWEPALDPIPAGKHMYLFGLYSNRWSVEATSLARAVRAFRVGCLFPEKRASVYVESTPGCHWSRGWDERQAPGGRVSVHVRVDREQYFVARVPIEDAGEDFTPDMLPLAARLALGGDISGAASDSTALRVASKEDALIRTGSRRDLENLTRNIEIAMAELERQRWALIEQTNKLKAELTQRLEQIWVIELFVGSKEEVIELRRGEPATAGTPVTLRQSVLCMDEEMAVTNWMRDPEKIGEFDATNLAGFDAWLLERPEHLDQIFPWPKGVCALRVRRRMKDRSGLEGLGGALLKINLEAADSMTYLLVRNGENLYRLWVDCVCWPRFVPSVRDFAATQYTPEEFAGMDWEQRRAHAERTGMADSSSDAEYGRARLKQVMAGMVAVQGLIERSDLLHPIPSGTSVFDPAAKGFNIIRDDEGTGQLTDGSALSKVTWLRYRDWLRSKIAGGVRCLWVAQRFGGEHDSLEERVGMKTVGVWPGRGGVYVVESEMKTVWGMSKPCESLTFLYAPGGKVYKQSWGYADWNDDGHERTKRVRFSTGRDELIPVDYVSWRVLEHLINDRSQREHYGEFFLTGFRVWAQLKAQAERERPFVDLVLRRCDADSESERARCERLVRWWKLKCKEHRTLGTDEAKALRMIEGAMRRGEDYEEDPERALFAEMT